MACVGPTSVLLALGGALAAVVLLEIGRRAGVMSAVVVALIVAILAVLIWKGGP